MRRKIWIPILPALLIFVFPSPSFSLSKGETPIMTYGAVQTFFVERAELQSELKADLGFGILDSGNITTADRGMLLTQRLGFEYAFENVPVSVALILPLAGTLSGGNDDYGAGNLVLNVKGLVVEDEDGVNVAVGLRQTLPTAGSGAAAGMFSRRFLEYLDNTSATSPYVAFQFKNDKFRLMADMSMDIVFQMNRNIPRSMFGRPDKAEFMISYNAGMEVLLADYISGMVEFGGFGTLSVASKQHEIFAIPSIRYRDREMSFGAGIELPVDDFQGQTDMLFHFDFEMYF